MDTITSFYISGYTSSNKYVTTSFWNNIEELIQYFLKKYPRFKGVAQIRSEICTINKDGLLLCSFKNSQIIKEFNSSKELKEGK